MCDVLWLLVVLSSLQLILTGLMMFCSVIDDLERLSKGKVRGHGPDA